MVGRTIRLAVVAFLAATACASTGTRVATEHRTQPPTEPRAVGVVSPEKVDVPPRLVRDIAFEPPTTIDPATAGGMGLLHLTLDEQGKVVAVEVIRSWGPELDAVITKAALNCQFTPAYMDGKPVKVKVALPLGIYLNVPPMPIRVVKPQYPAAAGIGGVEGEVVLILTVDKRGRVADVEVQKSLGPMFDKAAIEAALQCRFRPAYQNGKPVRARVAYPVRFRLEDKR